MAELSPSALARKAFSVSSWTLASRILGLVRDRLWGAIAGGSALLDAYICAFQIPNLLRNLFGEGALTTAFIPRYTRLRDADPAAAERFAGAVLGRLTLLLSAVALVLLAVCCAVLLWVQWSKAVLVAVLAAPMVPFLIFICLTAVLGGILNVRGRFWVAAAGPVVLNLCLISTIWMNPEQEIWAAPYAVLAAGIVTNGLSLWAVRRWGGLPPLSFRATPEEREFRRALGPSLVSAGVYQINVLLDTVIVYVGAIRAGPAQYYFFANRLLQFPMALIGHGVTTVAFPELSRRAGQGWGATGEGLRVAIRLQAFWLLPAAAGLLVCAEPLVRTIYQTGRFGEEAVARVTLVTQVFAFGLVPMSLGRLVTRAYHAHLDQATPFRISLVTIAANVTLNLILVRTPLQEAGLALASVITSTAGLIALVVMAARRGAGRVIDLAALVRPLAAAAAMAVGVWLFLRWWPQPAGAKSGMAALRLGASVALGMGLYLAVAGTGWIRRRKPTP